MDVRAKQLLCYLTFSYILQLRVAVSPHVISNVRWLRGKLNVKGSETMKNLKLLGLLFCTLLLTNFASAQSVVSDGSKPADLSPAYVALASHKSAVASELKNLLADYTAYSPNVLSKQFELEITEREIAKVLVMPETRKSLLSDSYGKLLVRKITTEAALRDLLREYTLTTPQVRGKSNELQAIENELATILLK